MPLYMYVTQREASPQSKMKNLLKKRYSRIKCKIDGGN